MLYTDYFNSSHYKLNLVKSSNIKHRTGSYFRFHEETLWIYTFAFFFYLAIVRGEVIVPVAMPMAAPPYSWLPWHASIDHGVAGSSSSRRREVEKRVPIAPTRYIAGRMCQHCPLFAPPPAGRVIVATKWTKIRTRAVSATSRRGAHTQQVATVTILKCSRACFPAPPPLCLSIYLCNSAGRRTSRPNPTITEESILTVKSLRWGTETQC